MAKPRKSASIPSSQSAESTTVEHCAPAISTREPAAEWIGVDDLRPWADNPRKNEGEPVRKVAESIRRFGFGAPILARAANREIIAGHTRWLAAKSLGIERVPVRFMDLDPADAKLLALADNRIAEEADWDDEKLAALIAELKAQGADVLATGFDDGEIDRLVASIEAATADVAAPEPQVSKAEELKAKWAVEPGQIWEIPSATASGKRHRIVCGDSRNVADVERLVRDELADCMWTDPPYGVAYVGKGPDALTIENDRLGASELFELLGAAFTAADKAALKRGAAVYVAHPAGPQALQFHLAFEHAGWRIHQGLIWLKSVMVLSHSDYHFKHEPILLGYVPGAEGRRGRGGEGWYGDNCQVSVFEADRPRANDLHPTMKPIELIVPMVRNSAPVGGVVFEPFCGSGSTMVACEATSRVCRAVEIDPKYVAVTLERMSEMGLKPEAA
jgi:DNA modification methylase